MAFTEGDMKKFVVGGILGIFALIIFANLLPYGYKYITEGPDNLSYTLADVPGGGLMSGLALFLLSMSLVVGLIIKILDF
jgi:hypothetical protein